MHQQPRRLTLHVLPKDAFSESEDRSRPSSGAIFTLCTRWSLLLVFFPPIFWESSTKENLALEASDRPGTRLPSSHY